MHFVAKLSFTLLTISYSFLSFSKDYNFKIKMENKITHDKRTQTLSIPYMEMLSQYKATPHFKLSLGLKYKKNSLKINKAYATYKAFKNRLTIEGGLFSIPLGYTSKNSKKFHKKPRFYKNLYDTRDERNLKIRWTPWHPDFYLEISRSLSYRKETKDSKTTVPPEFFPLIITTQYDGTFGNSFLSYYKKDLAFAPLTESLGAGYRKEKFPFIKNTYLSFQSEIWSINEKKENHTLGYYLFPQITFKKITLGLLYGSTTNNLANKSKLTIQEHTLQGLYQLTQTTQIILERFKEKNKTLNKIEKEGFAFRIKTVFKF